MAGLVACLVAALLEGCVGTGQASRPAEGSSPARVSQTVPDRSSESRTATSDLAPPDLGTPAGWSDWVQRENSRPGVAGWRISTASGAASGLDGFLDRVSVLAGEPVGLYVDATGPVCVSVLRIGDYAGLGARLVWSEVVQAQPQPPPAVIEEAVPDVGGLARTHTVWAPWHRTATLDTSSWPEGDYLLRLDGVPSCAASPGRARPARYVPLTVRSSTLQGRVVLVAGAMTWQAYNRWGGASLYDAEGMPGVDRSQAVSFDRPYDDGYGAGMFEIFDAPLVQLAEHDRLPLAWVTDYDLATVPGLLDGAAAVVFGGHAEYWTAPMRRAVLDAVAAGANLAVLGANTAYWRARLAGVPPGAAGRTGFRQVLPRLVVATKSAIADPLAATDPVGAMARFRDGPQPVREEDLTGMRYDCFPAETSWTVADPQWWGYQGTGVRRGQQLAGVVGPEADRVFPGPDRPTPEQVVAYQPYLCSRDTTAHTGVYWVAPSGAAVFATGTMRWVCALRPGCTHVPDPATATILDAVTTTVLTAFSQPRAGLTHPAHDNVAQFPLHTRSTTTVAGAQP